MNINAVTEVYAAWFKSPSRISLKWTPALYLITADDSSEVFVDCELALKYRLTKLTDLGRQAGMAM